MSPPLSLVLVCAPIASTAAENILLMPYLQGGVDWV